MHLSLRFAGQRRSTAQPAGWPLHHRRLSCAALVERARLSHGRGLVSRAAALAQARHAQLIGSHWRRQGLMLSRATGSPWQDMPGSDMPPALAAGRGRFVNRQIGSGTRLLLDHLRQSRAAHRRLRHAHRADASGRGRRVGRRQGRCRPGQRSHRQRFRPELLALGRRRLFSRLPETGAGPAGGGGLAPGAGQHRLAAGAGHLARLCRAKAGRGAVARARPAVVAFSRPAPSCPTGAARRCADAPP